VWDALTRIPLGETLSYGELAAKLGVPKAARAIGRACGSNKLALLVPCHRIIREDGSLGGWRWGMEIKRQLLATEHAMSAVQG
jgi:AraC family transcriptional regulator of adaptative response/methylated-DNA-[protein]-cysteine methyltransferase